jgi:hypothetical protein
MIRLKNLLNEETFTAINKDSGKVSVFKSKDSRDAAVKAGTHDKKEDDGQKQQPKGEKPNMFSKDAGYDAPDVKSSKPKKSKSFNMDSDEAEFENALEDDGFSTYYGDSLDGVSTFGDDDGNTVAVGPGKVYGKKSAFVVSGFHDNDPTDVQFKEFNSKEDAIAYAKELGKKLKKQNPTQKSKPKTNEPKSATGLPSDSKDGYPWSTGDKRMPVDKDIMKSVKKLSTKLGLNNPGRGKVKYAEYEKKMLSLVHNALEDANFHGANRQIFADLQGRPELAKRPDYSKAPKRGTPEREEWDMNNSIYNKNFDAVTIPMDDAQDAISDINSQSGWDGQKTLAALLTKMRQDGAGELADRIQTSYETAMANNESKLKLGNLIKNK